MYSGATTGLLIPEVTYCFMKTPMSLPKMPRKITSGLSDLIFWTCAE